MVVNILSLLLFSILLIKAAEWVIVSLRRIAKKTKFGVFAISAVILAVGTSLPELFVSITSNLEGVSELSLGVVLGSNVANTALIVGLASVITPIKINSFSDYRNAIIAFVVVFLTFWYFIRSKHRLDRWEGLILVLIYTIFIVIEFVY